MKMAKNVLNGQESKGKMKEISKEKTKKFRARIILSISIICLAVLSVLMTYEKLHRDVIVKVDNTKIYLDDMMYYIYSSEAQYNYYNQMYMLQMGGKTSYWDMDMGDGKTTRDVAKEDVLNTAIKYQVLYQEATKAGYKLTKEEEKNTDSEVKTILGQLSDKQKKLNGLSKAQLTKRLNFMAVADKYAKNMIDGFSIDDAAIKAGVNKEDYRQFDIQYYKASLQTTDKNGKVTTMDDSQQKEIYDKLTALYEKSKTASDFTKLKSDKDSDITYKATSFTAQDNFLDEDAKDMLMKLNNNEISNIVKVQDAYYFVKMINNNSSQSYDNAVKKAIAQKENEEFEKAYEKILKHYSVKVNNSQWDKIKMGNITS